MTNTWTCPLCGAHNEGTKRCSNCLYMPFDTDTIHQNPNGTTPLNSLMPPTMPPVPHADVQTKAYEEILSGSAGIIKWFAILFGLLGVVGCIVSIAEGEAWLIAIILPVVSILILPHLLISSYIKVYCKMSLNLHRINDNLQRIVNAKGL